jgi:hypothetical protein
MLSSVDPQTVTGPAFPRNAAKVDLEVDESPDNCPSMPELSQPATLGGIAGWQRSGPVTGEDTTLTFEAFGAYYNGHCFSLIAYFGPENHDQSVFEQIVSTFTFN